MKNSITGNLYQHRPQLNSSLTSPCCGSTPSGHRLGEAETHVIVLHLPEGHWEQPVQAFRLPAGDLHRHGHRHFPWRPNWPHLCDGPRPQRRAVLHAAASAKEHVQDKQTGRQHRGSAGPGTRQVGTTAAPGMESKLPYVGDTDRNALVRLNIGKKETHLSVTNYIIQESKFQCLPANNHLA